MDLDFQQLLLTLLPDLVVVVALFAALGVDYSKLRGAALAERYETAFRISALGLLIGLVMTMLQAAGKISVMDAEATHGQLNFTTGTLTLKAALFVLGLAVLPLAKRDLVAQADAQGQRRVIELSKLLGQCVWQEGKRLSLDLSLILI